MLVPYLEMPKQNYQIPEFSIIAWNTLKNQIENYRIFESLKNNSSHLLQCFLWFGGFTHATADSYIEWCVLRACSVAQPCPTLWDPLTAVRQAPLSMEFSRQEYWSGWPFPSPKDLPSSGAKPGLLCLLHWQASSLPQWHLGSILSDKYLQIPLSVTHLRRWNGYTFPSSSYQENYNPSTLDTNQT